MPADPETNHTQLFEVAWPPVRHRNTGPPIHVPEPAPSTIAHPSSLPNAGPPPPDPRSVNAAHAAVPHIISPTLNKSTTQRKRYRNGFEEVSR